MKRKKTQESQYSLLFDVVEKHGISELGLMINESWNQDPKRTLFTLSRYKFVAKMFSDMDAVLEVGCGDAFGTRIVQQAVKQITAIDFDPVFIDDVEKRKNPNWPFKCFVHDILNKPVPGKYDGIFCLDVLEHIDEDQENIFIKNMISSLKSNGSIIIGIPSKESQLYASPQSKAGHVNCKSGIDFKNSMKKYFENVFMFSMNDEVVHTGFDRMAHYLICLCCGAK